MKAFPSSLTRKRHNCSLDKVPTGGDKHTGTKEQRENSHFLRVSEDFLTESSV